MSSTITALTSGGGLAMAGDTSGQLELKTNNGTTAVTINTSQQLGIGTTSPSASLTVKQGSNSTTGGLQLIRSDNSNYTAIYMGGDDLYLQNTANGGQIFYTNNTERLRIDPTGTVLMNATVAWGAERFTLNYAQNTHWGMGINDTFGGAGAYAIAFASLGTRVGQISTTTSATTYTTSSDYRLKENIAPMTGALATVTQLKPVTYKWKLDGSNGQGFIAHELQAVVPDCVVGEKDATETYKDEDGNEQTRIKPQGIDTSFLVATLTAAIQEQQAIITDLKTRIETLEAK
jgi:hypothetical protein